MKSFYQLMTIVSLSLSLSLSRWAFVCGLLFADAAHRFKWGKFSSRKGQSHPGENLVITVAKRNLFALPRPNQQWNGSLLDWNEVPSRGCYETCLLKSCVEKSKYSTLHKYNCWSAILRLTLSSWNNLNVIIFCCLMLVPLCCGGPINEHFDVFFKGGGGFGFVSCRAVRTVFPPDDILCSDNSG